MADNPSLAAFQRQLQALREEYLVGVPERFQEVLVLWRALCASWDLEVARTVHRQVHSMTGAAGTFGYPRLTDAARAAETLLKTVVQEALAPTPEQRHGIERALAVIGDEIGDLLAAGVPAPGAAPGAAPAAPAHDGHQAAPPRDRSRRTVLLVDDDQASAVDLAAQLGNFGYASEVLAGPEGLVDRIRAVQPVAIILDVVFPSGPEAGFDALRDAQTRLPAVPPVIFTSVRRDIPARVAAVRVGGAAYFPKPLDVTEIVDALDNLTGKEEATPYRVLVIDDEPDVARHVVLTLEGAGMVAEAVNDPMAVERPLEDFAPDLILMDFHMPGCTGLELAAAIRQQPQFVGIPIVFVSAETDAGRQAQAMDLGGDRFLTKPVDPEQLIGEVASRAKRSRVVRALMVRDGLTGLFNHSHTAEHLEKELARAGRSRQPLSYVMLDLDLFKSINDTHGHGVGDRVLKSLARLLRERLRRSDIIGRYGGEEFAVILPDTPVTAAGKVIDELRATFERIRHESPTGSFGVTFSAGLASSERYPSVGELRVAADAALYTAKRQGRNRIVIAGREVSRRILVIDDEARIAKLLKALLLEEGHDVQVAGDGAAGLETAIATIPDLVISDVLLPRLDGFELCRRIKAEPQLAGVKIMLMTAVYKKNMYKTQVRDAGADDFIEKPFDPSEMLARVRALIGERPE